jgi:hypothetical protein
MAGDWIKFECTTPDKPEIVRMAATLGIDQDAVVGKLMRVWIWADQNSVDGNALSVTSAFLDRLTICAGFANAMRDVGWLIGHDGALTFPGFATHNGQTAKARAVTNRRVAKHRIVGNANVTPAPLQKALPEKRREEEDTNPPTPLALALDLPAAPGGGDELLKDNRPNVPVAKAIADLFNRRHSTPWDDREMKSFLKGVQAGLITMETVAEIEPYYAAERAKGDGQNFGKHRRDLRTFLNNFAGELDRARAFASGKPGGQDRVPDSFRKPMNKPPERPPGV